MDDKRQKIIDELFAKVATDIAYNAVVHPSHEYMDETEKRILGKLNEHILPVIVELGDEILQTLEFVKVVNSVVGTLEKTRDEYKELSEAQHKFIEELKLAAREYQAWKDGDRLFYDDRERQFAGTWKEYTQGMQATGKCQSCKQQLNITPGGYIPPLCENPECLNVILRRLTQPNSQAIPGHPTDDESGEYNHTSPE